MYVIGLILLIAAIVIIFVAILGVAGVWSRFLGPDGEGVLIDIAQFALLALGAATFIMLVVLLLTLP